MRNTARNSQQPAIAIPPEQRRYMRRFLPALVALAILATGCGSPKPIRYYEISYPPVGQAKMPSLNVTLLVRSFTTSHLYREDRIVYGADSRQMGTYMNERWSEPPSEMLQYALVRELRSSGQFRMVTALRSDVSGDFILTGHLYDFKEVSGSSLTARISFDAELRDLKAGKSIWTYTYSHDEPVSGKGVAAVVEAMDKNVQRAVQEVEAGVQHALEAYPAK